MSFIQVERVLTFHSEAESPETTKEKSPITISLNLGANGDLGAKALAISDDPTAGGTTIPFIQLDRPSQSPWETTRCQTSSPGAAPEMMAPQMSLL